MERDDNEEELLRSVALQNANSILLARRRAEQELIAAKEALFHANQRVTSILESITDAFVVLDREWRFTYLNQRALEIVRPLQKSDENVLGRRIWTVFPDLVGTPLEDNLLRAGKEQLTVEFELCYPTLNSWFEIRAFPGKDGLSIYFHDITRRKHAEEAVHESANRLQIALDAGHLADWRWVAAIDQLTLGPRGVQMFGLPSADPVTRARMRELLHPDDRERARDALDRALAERTDYDTDYRVNRPSGGQCWIAAKGRGVYAEDGTVLGMIGVMQDISERKQAEEALRDETRILELLNKTGTTLASKLDLQPLVQTLTDAATELSSAGFGAFFCKTMDGNGDAFMLYALSGASREAVEQFEMPGATPFFAPLFGGEAAIRCDDVLKDPRCGKKGPYFGMPQGHLPIRSFLAVPVVSRSAEMIGGLFFGHSDPGIFSERTERLIAGVAAQAAVAIDNARLYEAAQTAAEERERLLESERLARAEAERMSEMKDDFLATVSHELRSPLSAILGWSHVLKRSAGNEADLKKGLDTIERNARAQTQLIEDLLDMSRITSGKVRLDMQPVEPASFIEAAVETIKPAAAAKGINLEVVLDPAGGTISGDPNRLQQVIGNLLSNAVKFTPKEGKIRVLLQQMNSDVEISVVDTGIGIQSDFIDHVFERFRQADASTTRRHGGLGLGLAIVRHLTELHGGTVHATSPGEGLGSTFTVRLPVTMLPGGKYSDAQLPTDAPNPLPNYFKSLDLSGIRVLVVDDDPDVRELIRRVLSDCEAEVLTAGTVADALWIVERERPHVLVSDIGMPDADGFELLKRVRTLGHGAGGKIPAIALTAFVRSGDRTRALRAGFLAHIPKPVEPSELVATVASVAGRTGEIK
jgi:PAS domain S-box-containing protein